MKPAAKPVLAVLALLVWVGSIGLAQAQAPAPLPQPNLDLAVSGTVKAVVRQADGGVVFGGQFTTVNGVPRLNLARLLPNGTLDQEWHPSVNGRVEALVVDSNGAVYVGGSFSEVGGTTRSNLAKLTGSGSGTVDPTWDPHPTSNVSALAVDADGFVYAGGGFHQIGGAARNYIAKLFATGTGAADPNWNPSADSLVNALVVDGANVYCGGYFSTVGGQQRQRLAKLSSSGTGAANAVWNPGIEVTPSGASVTTLALSGDGSLFVGGNFESVGGSLRRNLMKLSLTGSGALDANWNPSPDKGVNALVVDGSSLYVGGRFASIGGQQRNNLAKVASSGVAATDAGWNPSPNSPISVLTSDGAGGVIVGGSFFMIAGAAHSALADIGSNGSLGAVAEVEGLPAVDAMVRQHNGGTILSGRFTRANGLTRGYFLRLQPDGTLDPLWAPAADGFAYSLAVDSSDAVFAAGGFVRIGGYDRFGVAKIARGGTGEVDADWMPARTYPPIVIGSAMAVDSNDRIYIGGWFGPLERFANTGTGTVDPTWSPSPSDGVQVLTFDASSGSLYVGGIFTSFGGEARSYLARLSTVGPAVVDTTWNPAPNGRVTALALDSHGALYVGGMFTNIGGVTRNSLAKVSTAGSGTIDPVWDPNLTALPGVMGARWPVADLAFNSQGSLFVGGQFTSVGGLPRNGLAKLASDGVGAVDASWNPQPNGLVTGLIARPDDEVIVIGEFGAIGGQAREAVAAFATGDQIFSDGFE